MIDPMQVVSLKFVLFFLFLIFEMFVLSVLTFVIPIATGIVNTSVCMTTLCNLGFEYVKAQKSQKA